MRSFDEIFAMAAERHGGPAALEALLPVPVAPGELSRLPDDRWLSAFSFHVFTAGFSWKVVEAKWPGFETAFDGFDPGACSMMDDEALEAAARTGGIGHMGKARAIRDNALMLRALAAEHGSAGAAFAAWPGSDFAGLLLFLKARGARLGGNTGAYALRGLGKDGFVLSRDVTAALVREGVVAKAPGSKSAMAAVQRAFDAWAGESGRPLMQISRVLALGVG
ncbi:DNA-3-methyladenine glycosylase I [Paralimibaculum aggregatum]|uniref:DNA-3-methyladenine glycosylase I n=1 Tax=Paralimibaculum aggregatum TaxID=3036245 RepID=A0ABQ6LQK6_9RHOB|nr:DNA-3-methyladenine glycosylase I [Limibaculum sp. NKW23]GMG83016.1 DNA-3-methyladenine glycosylase I [Limibaculum sp. NKW23]